MNYLSVENASKAYGEKVLFKDINFGITKGDKLALVAGNGKGKTSLLKIITGKDIADSGIVTVRKGVSVAYLAQEPELNPNDKVMDCLYSGESAALKAIRNYEEAVTKVELDPSDKNQDRLHNAMQEMDNANAWDYEANAKQILSQLQITDFEKQISQLSGGQKKRVALAQILIQNPDLIILDEPTNHLDLEMIEWLENYLTTANITLLIVTHDRYFLDRISNTIIELENGTIYKYAGNYSYYVEKKYEREQMQNSELEKAKNLFRRELEWVRKMPRARGTKAKARVDAFDDVKEKATQKKTADKLEINVKMTRLGGKILELINVSKAYGDKKILDKFSYVFKKNEKIGIVGKNGIGKTTFLNMLLGTEAIDSGKVTAGETVVFGYYSQHGMKLNDEKRVIEVIKDIAEFIPLANGAKLSASQMLQRFLFSPEVQYTHVSKLSGGERKRLYLLTVLMKNPNFLILDEPTNDLDILTLSVLEEFLVDFMGCVLIVTHDRYFMDKLVDHIFVFEGDGIIKDFPGNYSDYRNSDYLEAKQKSEKIVANVTQTEVKEEIVPIPPVSTNKRKPSFKEKHEYDQLTLEIQKLESQKNELTEKMNSGITEHDKLMEISSGISDIQKQLDEKSLRWLELAEVCE